ncbi:MAG: hypothetical protein ABIZ70_02285 [Gemmatimonadales bacterium]
MQLRIFAIALLLPVSNLLAQNPRQLARPEEFPHDFTIVRSVGALPDGRVVVTDLKENKVQLLNWPTGKLVDLGRLGAGPREYRAVGGVYHDKGGGLVVYDPQQQRYLPIDPKGEVGDVRGVAGSSGGFLLMLDDGPDQFVADTVGGVFTTAPAPGQDSFPLMRNIAGKETVVTRLKSPERRTVGDQSSGMTASRVVSFSPRDFWSPSPDGWVAVVRNLPYRVDWYPPTGAVVRGPSIPFTPLPVTEADKKVIRDKANAAPAQQMTINGQTRSLPRLEPQFAAMKPPTTGRAVRDERGRIWVERSRAAEIATSTWDIFDRTGAVVDRVEFPAGVRLIAVDGSWAYGTRTDSDELQHLLRFRLQ